MLGRTTWLPLAFVTATSFGGIALSEFPGMRHAAVVRFPPFGARSRASIPADVRGDVQFADVGQPSGMFAAMEEGTSPEEYARWHVDPDDGARFVLDEEHRVIAIDADRTACLPWERL